MRYISRRVSSISSQLMPFPATELFQIWMYRMRSLLSLLLMPHNNSLERMQARRAASVCVVWPGRSARSL